MEDFRSDTRYILLNRLKSEMKPIRSTFSKRIVKEVKCSTKVKQQRETTAGAGLKTLTTKEIKISRILCSCFLSLYRDTLNLSEEVQITGFLLKMTLSF